MTRTEDGRQGVSMSTNLGWVVLALVAVFALSIASIEVSPLGSEVAGWWPVAGLSVLLASRFRRRNLWLVLAAILVVTALANVVADRPLAVAAGYGVANAVASGVGARLLRDRGGRLYGLDTIRGLVRIPITAIACGTAAALIAGLTANVLGGGEFLQTIGSPPTRGTRGERRQSAGSS